MMSIIEKRLISVSSRINDNQSKRFDYKKKNNKLEESVLLELSKYEEAIYLLSLLEKDPDEYRKEVKYRIVANLISLSSDITNLNNSLNTINDDAEKAMILIDIGNKSFIRSFLQKEFKKVTLMSNLELYAYYQSKLQKKDYRFIKWVYSLNVSDSDNAIYNLMQSEEGSSFLKDELFKISELQEQIKNREIELPRPLINCEFLSNTIDNNFHKDNENISGTQDEIHNVRKIISDELYANIESGISKLNFLKESGIKDLINYNSNSYKDNCRIFYNFISLFSGQLYTDYHALLKEYNSLNRLPFHKKEKKILEDKMKTILRKMYREIEKQVCDMYRNFEFNYLPLCYSFPVTLQQIAINLDDIILESRCRQKELINYNAKLCDAETRIDSLNNNDYEKIIFIEQEIASKAQTGSFVFKPFKNINRYINDSYQLVYAQKVVKEICDSKVNSFCGVKVNDFVPKARILKI